MARDIEVRVPLSHEQTMTLLLQAAEMLQHRVVRFDVHAGSAEMQVDFSLRALSTFRVHAEAVEESPLETRLRLLVRPAFKLSGFTGAGQSQRIGWQLIGKMQEIIDPARYRALEDEVLPSAIERARRAPRPRIE